MRAWGVRGSRMPAPPPAAVSTAHAPTGKAEQHGVGRVLASSLAYLEGGGPSGLPSASRGCAAAPPAASDIAHAKAPIYWCASAGPSLRARALCRNAGRCMIWASSAAQRGTLSQPYEMPCKFEDHLTKRTRHGDGTAGILEPSADSRRLRGGAGPARCCVMCARTYRLLFYC